MTSIHHSKKLRKTVSHPRRQLYRSNFLDQVIARVDFASEAHLPDKGPSARLEKVIKSLFPVPEIKTATVSSITITEHKTKKDVSTQKEWWYFSNDRKRHIQLTPDYLVLVHSTYERYERLRSDFTAVAAAIFDDNPSLRAKRLGLRYVDKFTCGTGDPTDWSDYFTPKVLELIKLADDPSTISRALQWLEFNYGDTQFRFQSGIANPDYPSPVKRREFLLDCDAYCIQLLTSAELSAYLDKFHDKINRSFEEVITDKLRAVLRRKPR